MQGTLRLSVILCTKQYSFLMIQGAVQQCFPILNEELYC